MGRGGVFNLQTLLNILTPRKGVGILLDLKALLTKILDALKADYVVEQGNALNSSNISWWYRKWNSGILETGCYWSGTVRNYITVSSFGGYNTQFTFPTSVQPVDNNYQISADITIGNGFAIYGGTVNNKQIGYFTIYYLSTASGSQTGKFWVSVKGRWKSGGGN